MSVIWSKFIPFGITLSITGVGKEVLEAFKLKEELQETDD